MASLINIFVPIGTFFKDTAPLINSAGLHIYTRTAGIVEKVLQLDDWHEGKLLQDGKYATTIFITSEPFDEETNRHFYDDGFFMHVIEVKGGRATDSEVEKLSLRMVAKDPDKRIKAFMSKLQKYLKQNGEYGMGIGAGAYHSRIFYHRKEVADKILWNDIDNKVAPVTNPA